MSWMVKRLSATCDPQALQFALNNHRADGYSLSTIIPTWQWLYLIFNRPQLHGEDVMTDQSEAPNPTPSNPVTPGYRVLSEAEQLAVLEIKQAEERGLRYVDNLQSAVPDLDARWLAIGRTGIQKATMALIRAVTRPERIALPEDGQ